MSDPTLDPRVTPKRPDLAAAHLRGKLAAPRYAEGRTLSVVAASAPLRRAPSHEAPLETEALFGEAVVVYEALEGWAWAQLSRDGYVGYLPQSALGAAPAPTHRVGALRTHAYPGASVKLPPRLALSMGAQVCVAAPHGEFAKTPDGLHVFGAHLAPLDAFEDDFVAVAERFLETPYLWGGRTSEGIDCSGLVQGALAACGVDAPRDSDMMEKALGAPLAADPALRRGDLIFWKGHVGVMRDAATLLHANGFHMKVASEPLRQARERIAEKSYGAVTSIRRL